MGDAWAWLVVGGMGVLTAFIERRDGWRFAQLAERLDTEIASLRERVARLETQEPPLPEPPCSWWQRVIGRWRGG